MDAPSPVEAAWAAIRANLRRRKTQAREDAGTGPFSVSVVAQNAGKSVPATNLVWAPVGSVSTAGGTPTLSLPGIGDVPISAVRQIG